MEIFSDTIKRLRKIHDISQRDLAERIGIDFTYVSKFENGVESPPSEDVILKMAEVFMLDKRHTYKLILLSGKIPKDFVHMINTDDEVFEMILDRLNK